MGSSDLRNSSGRARERFRENLEVVLKAWSDPVLNHQGRFHEYHGVEVWPRPLQQPYPTVWMAATSTLESFELAGREGFHLMLIPFLHDVEELRQKVEAYLKARAAGGHDASTARVLAVWVEYVSERLHLTDLAGNFALGGLTDAEVRASLRRFMEQVAPNVSKVR